MSISIVALIFSALVNSSIVLQKSLFEKRSNLGRQPMINKLKYLIAISSFAFALASFGSTIVYSVALNPLELGLNTTYTHDDYYPYDDTTYYNRHYPKIIVDQIEKMEKYNFKAFVGTISMIGLCLFYLSTTGYFMGR